MTAPLRIVPLGARTTSTSSLVALQTQVYQQVKTSGRPCQSLMSWVVDRRNLEAAWQRVRSNDGAVTPGIDGVTCASIEGKIGGWLATLADDLYHRRYQPSKPRWVNIPKPHKPGETRRLGILTVRDRIVSAALKQVLEPVLEPTFSRNSFAFRPGRSVPGALDAALRRLTPSTESQPQFAVGVHLDVAGCFDGIDHLIIHGELEQHVADPELLRLLNVILRAGGSPVTRFFRRRYRGLVQGSALSPLLCNLYLHALDEALEVFRKDTKDGLVALRYADDLLLLARDNRTAEKGIACVRQVLRQLQLKLRDPKASAGSLTEGVNWLGVRLQPRVRPWSTQVVFGYIIPEDRVLAMLRRLTDMTTPPSDRIDTGAINLSRWIVSLNEQLREWRQAYLFADNAPEVFRAVDEHVRARVASLIQSVNGVRWSELHTQYRVRLPRGFWTWQVQGARLVNLSSLAPHNPFRLIRRPAWMKTAVGKQAAASSEDSFVAEDSIKPSSNRDGDGDDVNKLIDPLALTSSGN